MQWDFILLIQLCKYDELNPSFDVKGTLLMVVVVVGGGASLRNSFQVHDGLQRLWSAKLPWKLSITVPCFVVLVTEQVMTQQETEAGQKQEVEAF